MRKKIFLISLLVLVLLAGLIVAMTYSWETEINESFVATVYPAEDYVTPLTLKVTIKGTRTNYVLRKDYYTSLTVTFDGDKYNFAEYDNKPIIRGATYEYFYQCIVYKGQEHTVCHCYQPDMQVWMDPDGEWFAVYYHDRHYIYSKDESISPDYIMGHIGL